MGSKTSILGLNAYHGDSSACLVIDGELVAAAEEERFRRIKHWAGFPSEAVRWCLREGGINPAELDHVAVNRDPSANLMRKVLFTFKSRPDFGAIGDRLRNASRVRGIEETLSDCLGLTKRELRADVHAIEHHRAHMASAFLVSPFRSAAVASVDGFGDFVSTMWGVGENTSLNVSERVCFPHSLGLFYLAITQHLGFWNYGDEYKVMGLAPYGEATHLAQMRKLVRLIPGGRFELDLDYFLHHSEGVAMVWENGTPTVGRAFSDKLQELLGPARQAADSLTDEHRNIAASAQAMYEEALFHMLRQLRCETHYNRLCLAGGCAMNSVANGKILENTGFEEIYVQPAAGDSGGAIGAAFCVWNQALGNPRSYVMTHAYHGPSFGTDEVEAALEESKSELTGDGFRIRRYEDDSELCDLVAKRLDQGAVVGWFQGSMEWGPRALGNRSILCDPRRDDAVELLNSKIKRRESFRPFAPSILREQTAEWFECEGDVPFMSEVWSIRRDRRSSIPAVTHVDGTGRLQTVRAADNPLYHGLISAFHERTGVPLLLNTSFNENEPVVCKPSEALDCFLRTNMDLLVLGNVCVERIATPAAAMPSGGKTPAKQAKTSNTSKSGATR